MPKVLLVIGVVLGYAGVVLLLARVAHSAAPSEPEGRCDECGCALAYVRAHDLDAALCPMCDADALSDVSEGI